MLTIIVVVFLVGYALIALEHPLKIDKAATALVVGILLWVIYAVAATEIVPSLYAEQFASFLSENPALSGESLRVQVMHFVEHNQIIVSLGDISEILFFLIGAMTIVELIDVNGGFNIITSRITTRDKRRLLWIIGIITFFMSAVLDNLTTAIVMVTLLRKLIANYKERWLFAGVIIIAANSGGAWSPIGDVTTIMLWIRGNVTAGELVPSLILPSLTAFVVPTFIAARWLKGDVTSASSTAVDHNNKKNPCAENASKRERATILTLGVCCLLFVPFFKSITHLPPFMGILLSLGAMWVYTEIVNQRKVNHHRLPLARVSHVLKRIDTPTILFFLGILMAVAVLQSSGVLSGLSVWLDDKVHNVYAINLMIGALSSVVDNVPLVAGSIATYPIADSTAVALAADPSYAAAFVQDGVFWEFLAYCAGVGGSMLIIGSAAGVVVMGLEKMNFVWYLKNISLIALAGYIAGAGVYMLQKFLF